MKRTGPDGCTDHDRADIARSLGQLWRRVVSGLERPGGSEPFQPQQFWVLGMLAGGPYRMSDLAEITHTSSANVTGLVDRLAERGLVDRVRSEADRRVVEVSLTEAGREILRQGEREFCRSVGEVLAPLTEAEQLELMRLIHKVLE